MRFIKCNVRTMICIIALMLSMLATIAVLVNTLMKQDQVSANVDDVGDKVSLDANWIEENTMKLNPVDAFEVIDVDNVRIVEDEFFADLTFYLNRQYKEWNKVGIFENRYAFRVFFEEGQEEAGMSDLYSLYINDEDKLQISLHEYLPAEYLLHINSQEDFDLKFMIVFEDVKGGFTQTFTVPTDEILWEIYE